MDDKAITDETGFSKASLPTLEDVAARAGVSTATVSRCLNTPSVVSQDTRQRVMDAVAALNYAPNFSAQALAAKRTNTFGAIIPTMENAIFARGLNAFQEELGAHNITTLVASSSYRPEVEEAQIRTLVARGADGLLLIGHDRTAECYQFLEQRGIPFVVAWVHDTGQSRLCIGFDNKKAMRTLADSVLDHGHRSIAFVTAKRDGNDRARLRFEGVAEAMAHRGLGSSHLQVFETPYSISNGAAAFETLLGSDRRPSAVMCGNDVLAAGALTKAREMGLRVPDEVSVTGFDDIEIAEITSPALTTVRVPHRAMGIGAARLLIDLRNKNQPAGSIELEATVKWRDSLGPAPTSR